MKDWIVKTMEGNGGVTLMLDEHDVVVEAAGACRSLIGKDADSLPGMPLASLVASREQRGLREILNAMRETGETLDFAMIPSHDDEVARSHWRGFAIQDGKILASGADPGERASQVSAILRLTDSMPMLVAYVNSELRYGFNNSAYERAFNIPRLSLYGKRVSEFIDETSWQRIEPRMRRALAGEAVQYTEDVLLASGKRIKARIDYLPDIRTTGEVRGFYALIQDISDFDTTIQLLRSIHEITNRLGVDYDGTIEELIELGTRHLGCPIGIVSEVFESRYRVRWKVAPKGVIEADQQFALGDTYCDITLASDEVIATPHAGQDDRVQGHPCYAGFGLETYIGIPLRVRGRVYGTLNFSSPEPRVQPFSDIDIELVTSLAAAVERMIVQDEYEHALFRSRMEMERRAMTDGLTGLPNRASVEARLDREIEWMRNEGGEFCVAVIDIDHFKSVNDRYGHDGGDEVLAAIGKVLNASIRKGDCVGRLGGEEFMAILPGATRSWATSVLERMRQDVESLSIRLGSGRSLSVTISAGITEWNRDDTRASLYTRADQALYAAKHGGRNRICLSQGEDTEGG